MNTKEHTLCMVWRSVWLLAAVLALGLVLGCASGTASTGTTASAGTTVQESQDDLLASRRFYQRRAKGNGWFMTRSDPVMARSHRLSDVLRVVPGIDVIQRGAGALVVSGRSVGRCPLAVFVDGAYTTIRNVDELSLEDLAAVEVYRGPTDVPAGFHAPTYDRTCGALLVWSRIDVGS